MSQDQYIRVHGEQRPANDNERAFIANSKFIKGAYQTFQSVAELVAFHPNRMEQGMTVSIINYPNAGAISDFYLSTDPTSMLDNNGDSLVTLANFTNYWTAKEQKIALNKRVYNYAPNKTGGGRPTFPYTPSTESSDKWSSQLDASKGHRWVRWRTDDVDDNSDGVFDNWSIPMSIGESYAKDDYIENRFRRQDVDLTVLSSDSGLQTDLFYLVLTGSVLVNDVEFTAGKTFQHEAGNTYTFNSATVQESLEVPSSSNPDGTLNNEPTGWTDTPPIGSEMLWAIEAQKSVYGQLKSDWRLKRIVEAPNYVRYSNSPTPLPSTICGTDDDAETGTDKDTELEDAGWHKVYTDESYIATREDDNGGSEGPPFTAWVIDKINEESGEYTDYVYKLYDRNLDPNSPSIVKPTKANPTSEGFFDTPQAETSTKMNYVFSARKFFNGELKTDWSIGLPWNGENAYNADIVSDYDDNFKYDNEQNVDPAQITLTAELYRGISKLWEKGDVSLTFSWKKVYDNGEVVDVDATTDDSEDFYMLLEEGTQGEEGYLWDNQRLVVKPDAVTGKAIFMATITIVMEDAEDIVFMEEYAITDVTDGKDAKNLTVAADQQIAIYDEVAEVIVPENITLRAYQSNLVSPTFKWFYWDGADWILISTGGAYIVSGSVLIISTADLLASNGTPEEHRFAVTTHASDPDAADYDTTFSDFITVTKLGSAGVGAPGENTSGAFLDNESATMILDKATTSPVAGETGVSGRISTNLQVWDGSTKKIYGTDYSVAVAPNTGDIQFAVTANGNDAKIYINSWTSTSARSATGSITVTYGAKTFSKKFQVSTSLDAPGALVLVVTSDKGFQFSPANRSNKTLTTNLYDTNKNPELQTTGYEYRWRVAGVWTSWSETRTKLVTRANIKTSDEITVEARVTGGSSALRSAVFNITDIVDAATIRMVTDSTLVTVSNKLPVSKTDSSTTTIGDVTWRSSIDSYWDDNQPVFACEGEEDPSDITKFVWTNPYRIKGEVGSQGPNGDFFFKMYKQNGSTVPSDTATLSEMTTDGWVSSQQRPSVDNLYEVERRWDGEGVTFDVNGYPSTNPASGSKWSTPNKISGSTGATGSTGSTGANGDKGWAPKLAVVNDGSRRVHQLVDWIGGTGTKPGNVGDYLGSSGFVSSISSATDIRGATGATGAPGLTEGVTEILSIGGSAQYGSTGILYPNMSSLFSPDNSYTIDLGVAFPDPDDTILIHVSIEVGGGNSQYALFTTSAPSSHTSSGYLRAYWYKDVQNHAPLETHMMIRVNNLQRYVRLHIDTDGSFSPAIRNYTMVVYKLNF